MLNKLQYDKLLKFWFLPFIVGISISAGYHITQQLILNVSRAKNNYIKIKSSDINDKSKKSFIKKNISTNQESNYNEVEQDPSVQIKTINHSNNLSDLTIQNKSQLRLNTGSSDRIEKIFNDLFQTLPKP